MSTRPHERRRAAAWVKDDPFGVECAELGIADDHLTATGVALGSAPVPYRLDYELETGPAFVTRSLAVAVLGQSWRRQLRLVRHADGQWECETEEHGDAPLPPSGGDLAAIGPALDCDLARSPLTNLMPVRRHRLHEEPGEVDFLMAWGSVPDLGLHPSEQRYEHVRRDDRTSVVRYVGRHRDFVGELVLDNDGIVELYPELARRVESLQIQ